MNIKKCERGHFYNGDKYQTCPHCKEAEQAKDIPQDEEAKPIQGYQIDENMPETIAYGRNATAGDTVAYIPNDAGMIGELLYQNEDMVPQKQQPVVQQPVVQQSHVQNLLPVGWLVAVSGLEYGKQYPIFTCDNFIGSSAENTICIQGDAYVLPEHHCTLSFDIMQQKIVLNLESSTGEISVNDVRATESCYLNHKDKIQIGGSVYMLIELCRDGFSWWNTLPVQEQKKTDQINDIDLAFLEEQRTGTNLNMEDIRAKMRARHSVAFAPQKMPILAESNMQDVASMKAGETSVLMGDGMMDMSDLQETNVLAASTWRCAMCNGLNSEFAKVCMICGAKRV